MKLQHVAVAVVLGLAAAACSSDAAPAATPGAAVAETTVLVDHIRPAVAAVEAKLGGPQRYFEVNATPTLVNLFVANADDSQATAYIYVGATLQDPEAAKPASGATFTAAEMVFDEATVLADVRAKLPSAQQRVFSVVGLDGGGAAYVVSVESAQGGQLEIPVGADGTIIPAGG